MYVKKNFLNKNSKRKTIFNNFIWLYANGKFTNSPINFDSNYPIFVQYMQNVEVTLLSTKLKGQ